MLAEKVSFFKEWGGKYIDWLVVFCTIVAVAFVGYGLGRVSVLQEKIGQLKSMPGALAKPIAQGSEAASSTVSSTENSADNSGVADRSPPQDQNQDRSKKNPNEPHNYVASKNGTKYYPVGCAWGSRIKDANKVWFGSAKEAEEAGYEASARCK